ncbi:hypothetical protein T484DRAFT_1969271 [Baffinella frigidus]|nr:hypothetical protein T484DRAFT_1969271 [Cryptophyta sp. CCMP2293]
MADAHGTQGNGYPGWEPWHDNGQGGAYQGEHFFQGPAFHNPSSAPPQQRPSMVRGANNKKRFAAAPPAQQGSSWSTPQAPSWGGGAAQGAWSTDQAAQGAWGTDQAGTVQAPAWGAEQPPGYAMQGQGFGMQARPMYSDHAGPFVGIPGAAGGQWQGGGAGGLQGAGGHVFDGGQGSLQSAGGQPFHTSASGVEAVLDYLDGAPNLSRDALLDFFNEEDPDLPGGTTGYGGYATQHAGDHDAYMYH